MSDLTDNDPGARRATDAIGRSLASTYLASLVAADAKGAASTVDRALGLGIEPTAIHTQIIQPALRQVGALWEQNEITVADEHLATAISHQVLVRVLDALRTHPPCSREHVMLAAVQGQQHVLGLRMVADVLEGAGFNVLYLGADVPVEALGVFAAQHQPAIVGLTFGVASDFAYLAASLFAVRDAAPRARLMLGGLAVRGELAQTALPRVESSATVLQAVEALLQSAPQEIPEVFHGLRAMRTAAPIPRRPDRMFETTEEQLAAIAAESSEVAREYGRRAEAFRDLSLRDPLTDLGNRRAFDEHIHAHCGHGGRGTLLLIDLDEFKDVNDTYGHEQGDRVLKNVGEAIISTVRPTDFGARIGGDEFAVLLPSAAPEDANEVGERIRRAFSTHDDLGLTMSIGATPVLADARATLLAVDKALYAAKAAGRNTIVATGEHDAITRPEVAAHPGSYVSISRLNVPADRADELVEAFRRRLRQVDEFEGFLYLEVWRSDRDPGELAMVTHWRSREHFKNYMKSEAHRESHERIDPDLQQAIKLMSLEHMHTYDVVAE